MPSSPESRVASCEFPGIAFIGGGNMARSLIGALLQGVGKPGSIAVAEPDARSRAALERDFEVAVHERNADA
ncbi:MAG: NAD(P)-binding domain-containing protein, partial [Rhodanobacteraceae bacterium]